MKPSYIFFFLSGVLVMFGLSTMRGSNAAHHVYELRLYHVHEGKMDALRDRFRDHTDALFRKHNMKSIGYWSPEDAPDSQKLFIYILEHAPTQVPHQNSHCSTTSGGPRASCLVF